MIPRKECKKYVNEEHFASRAPQDGRETRSKIGKNKNNNDKKDDNNNLNKDCQRRFSCRI